jgi:transcriptional regulator with GAF, ATPase, and Fis domain
VTPHDGHPERALAFERVLSEVSARFSQAPAAELDAEIERNLRRLGEFFQVDRIGISLRSEDPDRFRETHSWTREGTPGAPRAVAIEMPPFAVASVVRRGEFRFDRLEEIPDHARRDRDFFRSQGIRSQITVALTARGSTLGGLTLASFTEDCVWPENSIERLHLLAQVFAWAIAHQRSDFELQKAHEEIHVLKDQLTKENRHLRDVVHRLDDAIEIVGESEAFQQALRLAEKAGPTDSTVLLLGETGTGKCVLARALHDLSPRRDRALIKVHCAALPASLIESELFGHEKGAFTGATRSKVGRFELADGGTMFLDEIGDLELDLQTRLLRVIQDGEFERVGSAATRKVDARLIAATNRDLPAAVQDGRFRADLFYRLNVFPIELPPLRRRCEDIPLLAWSFVAKHQHRFGKKIEEIPPSAMDALMAYHWPGNVRELENVIERALILSESSKLMLEGLGDAHADPLRAGDGLADVERAHILSVLEECAWKVGGKGNAAERLGLHPNTLRSRMQKLGITRP